MEEFLTEMAEILEEDQVEASDELASFESWDSLAVLSVVAMADAKFNVNLPAQHLKNAKTVQDLYRLISTQNAA